MEKMEKIEKIKNMVEEIEKLSQELRFFFHGKNFDVVFGAVIHQVGELGVHFNMPRERFLKMCHEGIAASYSDTMNAIKNGDIVATLVEGGEIKNVSQ